MRRYAITLLLLSMMWGNDISGQLILKEESFQKEKESQAGGKEDGGKQVNEDSNLLLIRVHQLNSLINPETKKAKALRNSLEEEAESILSKGLSYSVMANEIIPPSGDKHDYYSTGPYWWPNPDTPDGLPYINRDGHFNPERNRVSDRDALHDMVHDVRVLAIAHAITKESRYAGHAVKLLNEWFLNPETKMNANLNFAQAIPGRTNGRGRGIIDTLIFVELIDPLKLLASSRALQAENVERLKSWFADYLDWLTESENGIEESEAKNNHGTAYDLQRIAIAAYLKREDLVLEIGSVVRERMAKQIKADGRQPRELERTRTWSYSTENLLHFYRIAHILKPYGINLFYEKAGKPSRLFDALTFLLPYLCDHEAWPFEQLTAWQDEFIIQVLAIGESVYAEHLPDIKSHCLDDAGNQLAAYLLYSGNDH